jgi:hypothetical protein
LQEEEKEKKSAINYKNENIYVLITDFFFATALFNLYNTFFSINFGDFNNMNYSF